MAPRKRPAARKSEKPIAEPTEREPPEPPQPPEQAEGGCRVDESQAVEATEEPENATPAPKRPMGKARARKKPAANSHGEDAAPSSGSQLEGPDRPVKGKRAKTTNTKTTAKTNAEPNPFDSTPDADQKKMNEFFESKGDVAMHTQNMDVDSEEKHEIPQTPKTTGNPGEDSFHTPPNKTKSDATSNSSTSSSSSSRIHGGPGALGDFEDDSVVLEGSPCMVQPEQVRSRIQMFSYPKRHVQRLRKHWGDGAVDNLRKNLSKASVVSLYSGLGGAEIACQLLGNALGEQTGPGLERGEPAKPEFLLACDHNSDCQKVLHTHNDA